MEPKNFYHQSEYLQMDDEMENIDTNSFQQVLTDENQGAVAQDFVNTPVYRPEFGCNGQQRYEFNQVVHQNENYEYIQQEHLLDSEPQLPNEFNGEQEQHGLPDKMYDNHPHEDHLFGSDVQGTSDDHMRTIRGYSPFAVNQENLEYASNGRQLYNEDLCFNSSQEYDHTQLTAETRSQSLIQLNGVQKQRCSEDDMYAGRSHEHQPIGTGFEYTPREAPFGSVSQYPNALNGEQGNDYFYRYQSLGNGVQETVDGHMNTTMEEDQFDSLSKDPNEFDGEQDDYFPRNQPMEIYVQASVDRYVSNRFDYNRENCYYNVNGRQVNNKDVDVNANQEHGHIQLNTESQPRNQFSNQHLYTPMEAPRNSESQYPNEFNQEQENYCSENGIYDDFLHEHQSIGTNVQGTSDGYGMKSRDYCSSYINQETLHYNTNDQRANHEKRNADSNHGHDYMQQKAGSQSQSQNQLNGLQKQIGLEDDIVGYGVANGAQEFYQTYDDTQQLPNETQYQLNGDQGQFQSANSSQEPSMSPQKSNYGISKPKRHRTVFTNQQIEVLEERFERSDLCCKGYTMALAEELDLPVAQVKIWFKNRKQKQNKGLKQNQVDHHNQMPEQSPPNGYPIQTSSSPPQCQLIADSPMTSTSTVSHSPNCPTLFNIPQVKNSTRIEDWQVEVLQQKFAGKYTSTKAENEDAAEELGLSVDQVKYFMRKKRLSRKDK